MEYPLFWHNLRNEFTSLQEFRCDLCAHAPDQDRGWLLVAGRAPDDVQTAAFRSQFRSLATRGGMGLGAGAERAFDEWLNQIRTRTPHHFHAVHTQHQPKEIQRVPILMIDRAEKGTRVPADVRALVNRQVPIVVQRNRDRYVLLAGSLKAATSCGDIIALVVTREGPLSEGDIDRAVDGESGRLQNLWGASAELCTLLETDAFEWERVNGAPAGEPDEWKRRWSEETGYSVKELAKLCCGWDPGSQKIPNPTRLACVIEDIRRAAKIGDLTRIEKLLPTAGDVVYDEDWFFAREQASAWAVKRYPAFPYRDEPKPECVEPASLSTPQSATREARTAERREVGPNVRCAAWLKGEMKKRRFTRRSLSDAGGPDPKTTNKILRGWPVSEDVRDKLADALSTRGADITIRDIPTE